MCMYMLVLYYTVVVTMYRVVVFYLFVICTSSVDLYYILVCQNSAILHLVACIKIRGFYPHHPVYPPTQIPAPPHHTTLVSVLHYLVACVSTGQIVVRYQVNSNNLITLNPLLPPTAHRHFQRQTDTQPARPSPVRLARANPIAATTAPLHLCTTAQPTNPPCVLRLACVACLQICAICAIVPLSLHNHSCSAFGLLSNPPIINTDAPCALPTHSTHLGALVLFVSLLDDLLTPLLAAPSPTPSTPTHPLHSYLQTSSSPRHPHRKATSHPGWAQLNLDSFCTRLLSRLLSVPPSSS